VQADHSDLEGFGKGFRGLLAGEGGAGEKSELEFWMMLWVLLLVNVLAFQKY
jgi:hypothetical protein